MQNLRLVRPLVVFDLETTGLDIARDRIVQIALIRVEPDGGRRTFESLVDPGIPIPPEATAVHGITDADVAGKPTLPALREEIVALLSGADLAGYNAIGYDIPLLREELARTGYDLDLADRRLVDACVIFKRMERRDLSAALAFYCGRELVGAHGALADATATLDVLDAQVARYEELSGDVDDLHRFCNRDAGRFVDSTRKFAWNDRGEAVFAFGKHRGRALEDVARTEPGYLDWILGKDFGLDVRRIVEEAQAGRFPRRGGEPDLFMEDQG